MGDAAGRPAPIKITADMIDARPTARPAAPPPARAATGARVRSDGRVDFERGMTYAPRLTLLLMVANVLAFAWQLERGALQSRETIIAAGALVQERVLAGELWRLLSAAFLHGSTEHLVGNMLTLYILGMACEHAYGARRYAWAYLVSALGGSVLSMLTGPGPSVGASGAIFGLMGAIIVFLHRERDRFFVRDGRIGVVIAIWALYTLATGALNPVVDNAGHLGGLIAGAFIGWQLPARERAIAHR